MSCWGSQRWLHGFVVLVVGRGTDTGNSGFSRLAAKRRPLRGKQLPQNALVHPRMDAARMSTKSRGHSFTPSVLSTKMVRNPCSRGHLQGFLRWVAEGRNNWPPMLLPAPWTIRALRSRDVAPRLI